MVRRNRKKISQIINDYLYLPFFLLIILWYRGRDRETLAKKTRRNQGWKGVERFEEWGKINIARNISVHAFFHICYCFMHVFTQQSSKNFVCDLLTS